MIKMYRCPCHQEEFTESEFDRLQENKNCHKYCRIYDCYEYSGDYEVFWKKEKKDRVAEMYQTAEEYGYIITIPERWE